MAIDFCSARLKTKIHSSAVSCEGYDVTNLLSGVPVLQSKGFLAEGFTKPPVSICLKFFCNVDINHILLWVEVGCQKSNGLELFAVADSVIYDDTSEKNRPILNSCSSMNIRIGSCKLNHEPGVLFQKFNGRFFPVVPPNFLSKHFNTSAANVLRNCSKLEIKIFSTSNSTVPSMKKIEVWGQPGRYCPGNVKLNLYTLWNQPYDNVKSVNKKVDLAIDSEDRSAAPSTSSTLCDPLVPEEFLDPITLDIMAIPMTLPSGKTIDHSTLEKFEAAEAVWGRGRSDPFTGVPFSQTIFPVPDTALKSRIDKFLLENGHLVQFKGVGRTVGHVKNLQNKFSSSLTKSGDTQTYNSSSSVYHISSLISMDPTFRWQVPVPEERLSKQLPLDGGSRSETSMSVVEQPQGSQAKVRCGLKRRSDERSKGLNVKNHECDADDSLDSALQSVLNGLPSFIRTTDCSLKESTGKIPKHECCQCLSEDCLFTLPCGHLLCRPCLVGKTAGSSGKLKCEICNNHYHSSDVIRFHK